MLLAHVFLAVGFVWVYVKGKENKPFLIQGIRYGAAIAVLTTIPTYLIYYAVQPRPEAYVPADRPCTISVVRWASS
jgi:hypothetical protein